ncbi:hypothetical protein LINPERHAP1_LOCUS18309, partial [Linum perenne]
NTLFSSHSHKSLFNLTDLFSPSSHNLVGWVSRNKKPNTLFLCEFINPSSTSHPFFSFEPIFMNIVSFVACGLHRRPSAVDIPSPSHYFSSIESVVNSLLTSAKPSSVNCCGHYFLCKFFLAIQDRGRGSRPLW